MYVRNHSQQTTDTCCEEMKRLTSTQAIAISQETNERLINIPAFIMNLDCSATDFDFDNYLFVKCDRMRELIYDIRQKDFSLEEKVSDCVKKLTTAIISRAQSSTPGKPFSVACRLTRCQELVEEALNKIGWDSILDHVSMVVMVQAKVNSDCLLKYTNSSYTCLTKKLCKFKFKKIELAYDVLGHNLASQHGQYSINLLNAQFLLSQKKGKRPTDINKGVYFLTENISFYSKHEVTSLIQLFITRNSMSDLYQFSKERFDGNSIFSWLGEDLVMRIAKCRLELAIQDGEDIIEKEWKKKKSNIVYSSV